MTSSPIFGWEHFAGLVPLSAGKKVSHLERRTQWVGKHLATSSCMPLPYVLAIPERRYSVNIPNN